MNKAISTILQPFALSLIGIFAVCNIAHAAVSASVDRNPVMFGETFVLTVSRSGQGNDEPDLGLLSAAFRVLGTSVSSQTQIINGKASHTIRWNVNLIANSEGKITIPPIKVGNEKTQAIEIEVLPQSAQPQGAQRGIMLSGKINKSNAYPGEQISYTVKLLYSIPLQGSISPPSATNAVIEKIADDENTTEIIDNQRYNVVKQHYAIFAEQPGELEISGAFFSGQTEERSNNRSLFGGRGLIPTTKPISAAAGKETVQILAVPDTFTGSHWLPSSQLTLSDSWKPNPPVFKVGEPVTRTIHVRARDLLGTHLPNIEFSNIKGLKFYAEPAEIKTHANNGILTGIKTINVAIVPSQSGTLELPAIKLQWWNTKANQPASATIPKREIKITPAAESTLPANIVNAAPAADTSTAVKTITVTKKDNGLWPIFTAIFAICWLVTAAILGWVLYKRSKQQASEKMAIEYNEKQYTVRQKKLLTAAQKACESNDATAATSAIIQLASAHYGQNYQSLLSVLPYADDNLAAALKELDAQRYASTKKQWTGEKLLIALRKHRWSKGTKRKAENAHRLNLYPN